MKHLRIYPGRPPSNDPVDQIEIASPCAVPWASMAGDERVRFCGQCRQTVYNVAALSRPEARRLIEAREGRACVRILRRDDGTVVTADCWTRLRAARRKGRLAFLAMLVIVGCAQVWAMAFGWLALISPRGIRPVAVVGAMQGQSKAAKPAPTVVPPEQDALMGLLPPPPPPPPDKKEIVGKRMMGRVAHRR